MKYKVIDDTKIKTLWECTECKRQEEHFVWDHQNIGSPYCAECDEDMIYIETRKYKQSYIERMM